MPSVRRLVLGLSLTVLFWAIFDGIVSYLIPIYITNLGFSKTELGLIIAFQSITGAIFDFFISRYLKSFNYLKLFFIIFFLSFLLPFVLWSAHTPPLLLLSMTIWGLYYDLLAFAIFDFSGNHSQPGQHCHHIATIGIFKTLGYFIAPIFAGLLVVNATISFDNFAISYIFLIASAILFVILYIFSPPHSEPPSSHPHRTSLIGELFLWTKVGRILFPVLLFNTLICSFDYVFWTIGPLFSEIYPNFRDYGGLFMGFYIFPVILIGWFSETITQKFGKKRTAYVSFLLSSIILLTLFFVSDPILILGLVFFSSLFGALSWPAIRGAYVDYLSESKTYQKEIEGLNDFSTNIGQIIGPILSGVLADFFGVRYTFSLMAVISICFIVLLLFITPRHIRVALPK